LKANRKIGMASLRPLLFSAVRMRSLADLPVAIAHTRFPS